MHKVLSFHLSMCQHFCFFWSTFCSLFAHLNFNEPASSSGLSLIAKCKDYFFCCLTKKSAENTGFSLLLIKETLLIKLPSSSAELRRHASIAISTPTQGFATLIEEKKGQQHSKLQCCQRHDSSTGYASLNMPISILFSAVSTKIECPPRMQS